MKHLRLRRWAVQAVALSSALATGCSPLRAQDPLTVTSPDGRNVVTVEVTDGHLVYTVERDGRRVLLPSRLGFEFRSARPLAEGLRITGSERSSVDEAWEQPWGEVATVRDHHNQLRVSVVESSEPLRRFHVVFRAFDDGVGFRYELPEQPTLTSFEIQDELTEFAFADNARAWWIPSDRPRKDRSEMLYSQSPVSVLDSVQTPLTLEGRDGGTFIVIHEAHLVDYPRMFLAGGALEDRTLHAALAPMVDGVKARGRTPFATPWRTIQLADRAEDPAPSVLGLNLNPPSVIEDTGWIEPGTTLTLKLASGGGQAIRLRPDR